MEKKFGNFRLPKGRLENLKDMRLAFQASYGQRMSNDEFIGRLIACAEAAEPSVWEEYCKITLKREGRNDR